MIAASHILWFTRLLYSDMTGENETTCYKVSLVDRAVFSNAFEANTKALYSRFEAVISAVPLVVL